MPRANELLFLGFSMKDKNWQSRGGLIKQLASMIYLFSKPADLEGAYPFIFSRALNTQGFSALERVNLLQFI